MTYNPAIHHRRSIRLKGYDYSQCGAYFITIVTQGRECLFGCVIDDEMQLNDAGQMILRWWDELANKFPHVTPDTAVIMPNHFHGIIVITDGPIDDAGARAEIGDVRADVGADLHVGVDLHVRPPNAGAQSESGAVRADVGADLCVRPESGAHTGAPLRRDDGEARIRPDAPLPQIVQWFKTMTTNEYIRGVKTLGWAPFPGKLWQRNYYEHIIRDENAHNRIRDYIINNPSHWDTDTENPERSAP